MLAQLGRRLHVWIAEPPREPGAAWVAEHEPMLSAEERARHRRFARTADRDLFLASRVLLRTTLSRYGDIEPSGWTFRRGPHGRPEIANPQSPPGLRFSLSHTDGMVALMVHDDADGGIDVERVGRVASTASVARTAFAAIERDALLALPRDQRDARFYRLWTLKEAFAKATGRGLSLHLDEIWFADTGEETITLGCRESIEPDPSEWAFTVGRPSAHHVLATACRSGRGRPAREVELRRVSLS